jgi:hypothetical protein
MMTFSGNRMLKRPAAFYTKVLGIADFHAHVHLRLDRNYDLWGSLAELDDGDFEIVINPDCDGCPMTVLAHEFVHVEQYLTGKMREISLTEVLWCDKVYSQEADEGSEEYWNLPWEVDARERERDLALAYAETFVEK